MWKNIFLLTSFREMQASNVHQNAMKLPRASYTPHCISFAFFFFSADNHNNKDHFGFVPSKKQ